MDELCKTPATSRKAIMSHILSSAQQNEAVIKSILIIGLTDWHVFHTITALALW